MNGKYVMKFWKEHTVLLGIVVLVGIKLYFQHHLTDLFVCLNAADAFLVALPTILGLVLCMPLMWKNFQHSARWQWQAAIGVGLYHFVWHVYWLLKLDSWVVTAGFALAGVLFFSFAMIGLANAAGFGLVLWRTKGAMAQ